MHRSPRRGRLAAYPLFLLTFALTATGCSAPDRPSDPSSEAPSMAPDSPGDYEPMSEAERHAGHDHDPDYWTCSMHPSVRGHEGDTCPICSMDLTPVRAEPDAAPASITVEDGRRRQLGIRTAVAAVAPMTVQLRTYGQVAWDEDQLVDVEIRVEGWVTHLHASRVGDVVRRGQPLFTIYSPDLFSAQQDWLRLAAQPRADPALIAATRERLRLWGLAPSQLDAIAEAGVAHEEIEILAPASGILIERPIARGASVRPGDLALRIAGADPLWVEAHVLARDLSLVSVGHEATLAAQGAAPGSEPFGATVAYVYPDIDPRTRTGRVRLVIANPDGALRPGGLVDVQIQRALPPQLQVPASAVLYTGPRRIVFVDRGEGRLDPRDVVIGQRQGDRVEILSGLEPGDVVAVAGTFLLAAESRVRDAAGFWSTDG